MNKHERTPSLWNSDWAILIYIALAKVAFHVALLGRYGYFRNEFYYIACSDHLAWGYVDHPPFSIAVLAVARAVLGDSLLAIRLLPMLAGGLTIFLTGLIARELGGKRFAQVLAAVAVCVAPNFLAMATLFSMNAFEQSVLASGGIRALAHHQDRKLETLASLWPHRRCRAPQQTGYDSFRSGPCHWAASYA